MTSCLVATLQLFGDDYREIEGDSLELGEGKEIILNLTISNTGDPAYTAAVALNFRYRGKAKRLDHKEVYFNF